jgi:hypothetical protein
MIDENEVFNIGREVIDKLADTAQAVADHSATADAGTIEICKRLDALIGRLDGLIEVGDELVAVSIMGHVMASARWDEERGGTWSTEETLAAVGAFAAKARQVVKVMDDARAASKAPKQ